MTVDQFRNMALSLPDSVESAHMEHPDFRVGGRIFASLGYPDERHGVLMLSPEEQKRLCEADPARVCPRKRRVGRNGSTQVNLKAAENQIRATGFEGGL